MPDRWHFWRHQPIPGDRDSPLPRSPAPKPRKVKGNSAPGRKPDLHGTRWSPPVEQAGASGEGHAAHGPSIREVAYSGDDPALPKVGQQEADLARPKTGQAFLATIADSARQRLAHPRSWAPRPRKLKTIPTGRLSFGPRCLTAPQAARQTGGAFVDPALAPDELLQRLRIRLGHRRVPHDAGPFAPCPFVSLGGVRSAPNDRSERVFPIRDF
jgi:hypothetical protein